MKRLILNLIFIGAIISFSGSEVNATTLVELSLEEMCMQSDEIVEAKVVSINSYRDPEMGNHVFTDIEIEIADNSKGKLKKNSKHIIKMFGGTVDGKTTMIVGSPYFVIGEETMLFLKTRKSKNISKRKYSVIGLSQGKFDIVKDKKTGEKKIKRNQSDMPLKIKSKDSANLIDGTKKIKLNDFKNLVHLFGGGR